MSNFDFMTFDEVIKIKQELLVGNIISRGDVGVIHAGNQERLMMGASELAVSCSVGGHVFREDIEINEPLRTFLSVESLHSVRPFLTQAVEAYPERPEIAHIGITNELTGVFRTLQNIGYIPELIKTIKDGLGGLDMFVLGPTLYDITTVYHIAREFARVGDCAFVIFDLSNSHGSFGGPEGVYCGCDFIVEIGESIRIEKLRDI